ncbi:hypothetical protein B0H13DRAFT_2362896 [Mycena leptocephala]|nr:hypothetical protein B0H13DRAFT_2362896 [Mycena leptocephala]
MPYVLRDKLTIELEAIGKREIEEPFYRGETDERPPTPDSEEEEESEESEAPSSSPPSSSPSLAPSSSPSLPPSSSPPSTPPRRSSTEPSSPPWSPHVGGQHRYAPYPQVWRRFGFLVKNKIMPIELHPRVPLVDITPKPTAITRAHLRRLDFRLFDWNLEATPWVDGSNLIGAVLLGSPTNLSAWDEVIVDTTAALAQANAGMDRSRLVDDALRDGVKYGGPRGVRPQNTYHSLENCVELAGLRNNAGVKGVISFQNEMYRKFFPKMWDHGVHTVNELRKSNSELHMPFDEPRKLSTSMWTAVEYQFAAPDKLLRKDDRDSLHGVRALTVLGTYDTRWTDVGDIIFWGSKVYASFPVGSTFIFPAWWMPYSFTMVDRDETHYMIMQHMDAGIDRWIENGGMSDGDFEKYASETEQKERKETRENRLYDIIGLFSYLHEL